jgi:predicted DNA-binding WGR domain protein
MPPLYCFEGKSKKKSTFISQRRRSSAIKKIKRKKRRKRLCDGKPQAEHQPKSFFFLTWHK